MIDSIVLLKIVLLATGAFFWVSSAATYRNPNSRFRYFLILVTRGWLQHLFFAATEPDRTGPKYIRQMAIVGFIVGTIEIVIGLIL